MQALVEPRREILATNRNQRSRARVAGLLVISVCALTAFIEKFVLGGVIFPIAVASRSMAPALLGPVRAWTCASCSQEFV
ncbi:MAG TPA: hypothetical protein VGJ16_03205, partial [Pirellulales bacterium]